MLAADLTTAALGVSDPRTWDATSWLSDVVPHLAFGAVVYDALAEPLSGSAAPVKSRQQQCQTVARIRTQARSLVPATPARHQPRLHRPSGPRPGHPWYSGARLH
jgi:hypothetical protein